MIMEEFKKDCTYKKQFFKKCFEVKDLKKV